MRRTLGLRELRRGHVAVGALMIGIPASVAALSAAQAQAQNVTPQPNPSSGGVAARVKSRRITYGSNVVLNGYAAAGHELQLEYAPAGSSTWTALTSTRAGTSGRFHLSAPLRRSGLVKVVDASPTVGSALVPNTPAAASDVLQVSVAAKIRVSAPAMNVFGARPIDIRGKLLAIVPGRNVRLEGRSGGHWRVLATARTGLHGGFDLRYSPQGTGSEQLRVRFAGDRLNGSAGAPAGTVTVYRPTVASWYDDGGSTACGFHAYYGVANRDLPCGTQVTFFSGGRTVTATVDDRGPYVDGRDWDLNQNTAAALGFGGVGTVWSSI